MASCAIDETKYVSDVYNNIAHHFRDTRAYKWQWVTDFVTSFPEHSTIYDVGCGSGRNMEYENYHFIGLDNCDAFINMCLRQGKQVVKSCMTNIELPSESCDGLMCIAAFHHLTTERRRIYALQEMKRVLKSDGKMLISVWSKTQPQKTRRVFDEYGDTLVPWKNHDGTQKERFYYIFQLDEIKELFEKVGLVVESHSWETGNEVFVLSKKKQHI